MNALVTVASNTHDALNDRIPTLGIFLDLRKSFNTVSHDFLLKRLGFHGLILNTFMSYLSEKKNN